MIPWSRGLVEHIAWEDALRTFPRRGNPGVMPARAWTQAGEADALLWYEGAGTLRAWVCRILREPYPAFFTGMVDPGYRRHGVGLRLLREADRRWQIDFAAQEYSVEGAALVRRYLQQQGRVIPLVARIR